MQALVVGERSLQQTAVVIGVSWAVSQAVCVRVGRAPVCSSLQCRATHRITRVSNRFASMRATSHHISSNNGIKLPLLCVWPLLLH